MFDPKQIRQDFPILDQRVYDKSLVYLDNAATTQKPKVVLDALYNYYAYANANIHRGAHALGERATLAYEGARERVRSFLNAREASEIVFVRNTTEAINLVAHSFAKPRLQPGDEILLSVLEHHANIIPWQIVAKQAGATLSVIPMHDSGELDHDAFRRLLNPRVKLLALGHISNAIGTINPIQTMIAEAHALNIPVLIDGAQAVAHQAVDVQALDCDFYAFSGHKLYAPMGIGVLYAKRHWLDQMPPYQGGGNMIRTVRFEETTYQETPYRFEAGTPSVGDAVALTRAIDYLAALGWDAIKRHESDLLNYALNALKTVPDLQIVGHKNPGAGIVSFTMQRVHPHDVATLLDQHGVAVRAGHHCAMPLIERLSVPATTRASFAIYNTHEDIDTLVTALHDVRGLFR